jgi:hypothetical protein
MTARPHRRSGFAFIVVLSLAALLGSFVAAALRSSLGAAGDAAYFADVSAADAIGRAAPQLLGAYAEESPARRRAGAFEARFAHARLNVSYVNAAARVDVNAAPVPLLLALLVAAGASQADADVYVARLTGLRGKAAPTSADGQAAAPLLRHPDELAAALGLGPDLAARLGPLLTTASGAGVVDPTLADRLVVAALFGGSQDRLDDFLRQRDNGFPSVQGALALIPAEGRAVAAFDPAPTLLGEAVVTMASGLRRRYEFVLTPPAAEEGARETRVHAFRPVF